MPNNVFPSRHPLVAHKLTLLRSTETKPKKFRELIRELSILLCVEATADLETERFDVTTPMGQAVGQELRARVVSTARALADLLSRRASFADAAPRFAARNASSSSTSRARCPRPTPRPRRASGKWRRGNRSRGRAPP